MRVIGRLFRHLCPLIRTEGNWEAWLKFFVKGVAEVSRSATETARHIVTLREKHQELIFTRIAKHGKAIALLDYLFKQPIVTARLVEQRIECVFATSARLLEQFTKLGILKETTGGQRNRRFEYRPYLELFEPERMIRYKRASRTALTRSE